MPCAAAGTRPTSVRASRVYATYQVIIYLYGNNDNNNINDDRKNNTVIRYGLVDVSTFLRLIFHSTAIKIRVSLLPIHCGSRVFLACCRGLCDRLFFSLKYVNGEKYFRTCSRPDNVTSFEVWPPKTPISILFEIIVEYFPYDYDFRLRIESKSKIRKRKTVLTTSTRYFRLE